MNKQELKKPEPRLSIAGLRKMRSYYLQNIAKAADEIAAIDCEIERLNMKQIGDDGL